MKVQLRLRIFKRVLILGFIGMCGIGCNTSRPRMSLGEYKQWLNSEESTLRKTTRISGYKFALTYVIPRYLVINDLQKTKTTYDETVVDSLVRLSSQSLTFYLEIGPDETSSHDAITGGLSSKEEFYERVEKLNFQLDEKIELRLQDSISYSPVLVHLENTYEIEKSRKIIVVFSVPEAQKNISSGTIDFSWNDTVYHTGIHHFIITSNDIATSPVIILNKP